MVEKITSFQGEHRFLSNFYPAKVQFDGVVYPTVEHAYQAAKNEDPEYRAKVLAAETPGGAKKLGKKAKLRPEWERGYKMMIMELMLRQKFLLTPELGKMLLDTGTAEIIEANNWGDSFWGVYKGKGANQLGGMLMKLREELRAARGESQ